MTFKKMPIKPPKPSLGDLLRSGEIKTGAKVIEDERDKAKREAEFADSIQVELSHRKSRIKT